MAESDQNKPVQSEKSSTGQTPNKYRKGGRRYYPKKRYYKPQTSPGDQAAQPVKVSFQKISIVVRFLMKRNLFSRLSMKLEKQSKH